MASFEAVNLPSSLAESLATAWAGDAGGRWLEQLPIRLSDAEQRWGITIGEAFEPGGVTSFVALARTARGDDVVYKITIPHSEAIGEPDALAAYQGDGAVQMFDARPESLELLLENARPGDSLWTVGSDEGRLDVACSLMKRLWRTVEGATSIAELGDVADAWADVTARRISSNEYPWTLGPVERGIDLLRSLPAEASRPVLLHGDFHPGNILRAEREPWLVIDPKPMLGDPAFEPVQLLTQRNGRIAEPPPHKLVEERLVSIADRVDLDVERIALWGIARTSEWSMWSWDNGNTIDAAIAYTWARTLDAIVPDD